MNITPALVIEFEAMGYHSLEDLQKIGWEKICITYSKTHTQTHTPEFFTLLFAIVNNMPLKKVTKEQIKRATKLYKKTKASDEAGFARKSKKKTT